jgi:hypothetical protein
MPRKDDDATGWRGWARESGGKWVLVIEAETQADVLDALLSRAKVAGVVLAILPADRHPADESGGGTAP